jgi:receptor protein-tyrosine kinase
VSRTENTTPDLIEVAVERIQARKPAHTGPTTSHSQHSTQKGRDSSPLEDRRSGVSDERRFAGDAIVPTMGVERGLIQPTAAPRASQQVDVDLAHLATLGFLQPGDPDSLIANEFRKIKRPLIQACQGKLATPIANANRIMVTSSVPGEGKSYVALNLALSIAMERDSTVLLIDADTTRRSLSRLLRLASRPGLLDLLSPDKMAVPDVLLRTGLQRLTLLPAGEARRHSTELLASTAMEALIEELASRYKDRILILDTPPLLGAPEPAALALHMGQIIVVVEAEKTTHKVLTQALTMVQSCPYVATVLNKASASGAGYYYYAA